MSLHCVYLVSSRSDFLDKGYHILLVLDTHLLCYARERSWASLKASMVRSPRSLAESLSSLIVSIAPFGVTHHTMWYLGAIWRWYVHNHGKSIPSLMDIASLLQ